MELNADTFRALDDNLELRQLIGISTANCMRCGRLPGTPFSTDGMFVNGSFEIEHLQCTALLASGMVVSVDERASVTIAGIQSDKAYMTVGFGNKMTEFEAHDTPFVRPTYECHLMTLDDIENVPDAQNNAYAFTCPIVRFNIANGRISVDRDYIAPCLVVATDSRLTAYRDSLQRQLEQIASHKNMEDGDARRALLQYAFRLKCFNTKHTVEHFMELLYEVAMAVGYYIYGPDPSSSTQPIMAWSQYDVQLWLAWFEDYLNKALGVVENTVPVDNSIDYDALCEKLRREIYAMVKDDMEARIDEARTQIKDELHMTLSTALRQYIDGTFRETLHNTLSAELEDILSRTLYTSLYQALYDALYTPQTEDNDSFMPLI